MKTGAFFAKILKLILWAVLAVVILHGWLLKPFLSSSLAMTWDTDVDIGKASIAWSLPGVILEDVRVGNPYSFPRGDMLVISRAVFRFDKNKAFLQEGALKPELAEISVKKVALMRRVSGHLNLELLVNPEKPQKTKGLKISPRETRIIVGDVEEIDASEPLLRRKTFELDNSEFVYNEKRNFRIVAQNFARELFYRTKILIDEANVTTPPVPQYQSMTELVGQGIREQQEREAAREKEEISGPFTT